MENDLGIIENNTRIMGKISEYHMHSDQLLLSESLCWSPTFHFDLIIL